MILSFPMFCDLWDDCVYGKLSNTEKKHLNAKERERDQVHKAPLKFYIEYVKREISFYDYLDLFRVVHFNNQVYRPNIRVSKPGQSCLDFVDVAHLKIPDWQYIEVGSYPWAEEDIKKNRRIENILIGEAGRNLNTGTFFYGVNQNKETSYFDEPCKVFGIDGNVKADKLIKLANNGVLLVDIFPFGLDSYEIIRDQVDIQPFYENLIDRLNFAAHLFNENVEFALVAPLKTSYRIMECSAADGGILINHTLYNIDQNTIEPNIDNFKEWSYGHTNQPKVSGAPALHNYYHNVIEPYHDAVPVTINRNGVKLYVNQKHIQSKRKIAVVWGGGGPKAIMLAYALDI